MALEYFLYRINFNNTLVDRSKNSFAPLPPNTGEIFINYFIPTNQPLYYYRESGGTIVLNNQQTIDEYLNATQPIQPDDTVEYETFSGYTATTQQQIDELKTEVPLYAFSKTQAGGTQDDGFNLSVNRVSTGTYDYTFDNPASTSDYGVFAQPFGTTTDTNSQISNVTINGFRVEMGQGDNGTTPDVLVDTNHSVIVYGVPVSGATGIPVVSLSTFTGYTAQTQTNLNDKIDKITTGTTNNVPIINNSGGLKDSGFAIADLTGSTGGGTWGSITGNIVDQIDLWNDLQNISGATTGNTNNISSLQNNKVNRSGDTITDNLKIEGSVFITGTSATTQQLNDSVLLGAITTDGRIVATTTPALNVSENVIDISGNTTISELSGIYYVDTSSGNITLQIPDATTSNDVSRLTILKKTSDANIVIITTTGGTQNIGNSTTQTIGQQDNGITIVSDADNNKWLITNDSRFPDGDDEGTLLRWNNTNKVWESTTNDVFWNKTKLTFTVGGNSSPPTFQADASNDILYINTSGLTGLVSADDLGFYAGGRGAFGNSVTLDKLRNNVPGNVPRALSLIDTTATLRIWRFVNDANDPAVELVWGTDNAPDSVNNAWWDFFLDGAPASSNDDNFAIRRRSGGGDDKILTITTSGISTPYNVEFDQKLNFGSYINSSSIAGDLWFTGSELFFNDGANTTDLLDRPTALTAVQIRRTTNFTVPATWGDITFGTVDVQNDVSVLSADTVNTDRIIIGQDGLYEITYDGVVNDGGVFRLRVNDSIVINGSTKNIFSTASGGPVTSDFNVDVSNTVLVELNLGDFITFQAQQTSTGAATLFAQATLKVTKLDSAKGATGPQGEKGEPGSGVAIIVYDEGVNPNPTGGTYSILNFSGDSVTAQDGGDGQTVNIIVDPTISPIKNVFQAYDSVGNQSLNDVVPNPIEWGTVDIQDTSVFSFTAGNNAITVLKDGWYELSYNVNGAGPNGRVIVGVQFRRNTISIPQTLTSDYARNNTNNDTNSSLSPYMIQLNTNDVLDVVAFELGDSGTVSSKTDASFIKIKYLG